MGDKQYRVRDKRVSLTMTPSQMIKLEMRRWLEPVVESLKATSANGLWVALQASDVPEHVHGYFARAEAEGSRFILPEDMVYMGESEYPLMMHAEGLDEAIELEADHLPTLQRAFSGQWQDSAADDPSRDLVEEMIDCGVVEPTELGTVPWQREGIYRLQHASLMFRSKTTTIITDPVTSMNNITRWFGMPYTLPKVDGILISHGHGDHYDLACLLRFPFDTTIVVPKSPGPTLLAPDMAGNLRAAGFTNVLEPEWYSTVRIGDIDVHVYPFYGEQPWITFEAPDPQLRNHGNTYLVDVQGHKTWILIDSGVEYGKHMCEVAPKVREQHGRIDLVMSNLREFPWRPDVIDSYGSYFATLPLDIVANPDQWPYDAVLTIGRAGIRELLLELEPRCFMPYAHWWQEQTREPHLVDGRITELQMIEEIADPSICARQETLHTELKLWQVSDFLRWRDDKIEVVPFEDSLA